jgi:hypothetical protein
MPCSAGGPSLDEACGYRVVHSTAGAEIWIADIAYADVIRYRVLTFASGVFLRPRRRHAVDQTAGRGLAGQRQRQRVLPRPRGRAHARLAISMPKPTSSGETLLSAAQAATRRGPPPVHLWDPPFCGYIDMRIARDGSWFYLGTPIGRPALVRLFSSILKREGDRYYLVTPVEKIGITVDDAAFVAVDFTAEGAGRGQKLVFTTQVGDTVTAGPDNPIRVVRDPASGEPAPYVHVRRGLEALIDRKSFYRLVELGVRHADDFGVWSDGSFFAFIPAAELDATGS